MYYQPKRSTARWLVDAPAPVLAVYDNGGKSADRYTVLYGAPLWDRKDGRMVPARFMSDNPYHPQGVGMFGEAPAHSRAFMGRKIRFDQLPARCQQCVIQDCMEETQ
jgi:hypothetical protein